MHQVSCIIVATSLPVCPSIYIYHIQQLSYSQPQIFSELNNCVIFSSITSDALTSSFATLRDVCWFSCQQSFAGGLSTSSGFLPVSKEVGNKCQTCTWVQTALLLSALKVAVRHSGTLVASITTSCPKYFFARQKLSQAAYELEKHNY